MENKKRLFSALLVIALIACFIPAMKKEAKAGQYDYYLTFDSQGGHVDSATGPSTKKVTLSQSYYACGGECQKHTAYKDGYNFLGWYTAASGGTKITSSYYGCPSKVYAHWEKKTYTVTFNANGGSGAPGTQKKTHGVNLTLSSTKPSRTGYDFLGWSTSKNGAVVYAAGATYKNNSNVTLYAIWRIKTYTITAYKNANGTGGTVTATKNYGASTTIPSVPAPTGQYLAGYGTSDAKTTIKYHAGDTYSANANLTLYPIFYTYTYTVSYNANGGSGAPAAQTKTYGVNLTLSTVKPTKTGYDFKYWSTSPDGPAAYYAGSTYTNNSAVTLYAVYSKKIYTITIYTNPGGQNGSTYSMTKEYGASVTIPSTSAPTGYTLVGYATSGTATTATVYAGTVYSDNANLTLYPIFKKITYTVSYDANGGTNPPAAQTKTYGESLTLSSTKPQRTGYTFKGWSDSKNGTVKWAAGAQYTENASVTLYAKWEIVTYTITICDGTGTGSNPGSTYTMTKTYGVPLQLGTRTSTEAKTFLGYSKDRYATEATYAPGAMYTDNKSATLFEIWRVTTYTIEYDLNGATGTVPETQIKTYGIDLKLSTAVLTREGYDLLGWSTNKSATSAEYYIGATYKANASAKLYAVWQKKTYRIGFNGFGAPSGLLKEYGVPLTIPGPVEQKEGYTFGGWSYSYMTSTASFQPGDAYTDNCSIEFFAVWVPNGYLVKYNLNGAVGSLPDQVKYHDEALTLTTEIPTRSGYEFEGWGLKYDDTTPTYQPGDVYTGNAGLSLYAIWSFVHASKYDYVNTREGYLINDKYVQFMSAPAFLPSAVTGKLADLGESVLWKVNKLSCGYYTFTRGGKYLCENGSKIELATYDDTNIPTKAVWIVEEVASDDAPYVKNYKLKNYSTGHYLCQNNEAKYEPRFLSGQTGDSGFVYDSFYTDGSATWCFVESQFYSNTASTVYSESKAIDVTVTLDVFATLDTNALFSENCLRIGPTDFDYTVLSGEVNATTVENGKLCGYTGGRALVQLTHKLTGIQSRVSVTVPDTAIIVLHGIMGGKLKNDTARRDLALGYRGAALLDLQNVSNWEAVDSSYGMLDTYKTLITQLTDSLGNRCDVRFCSYQWMLSNAVSASNLEAIANEYDRVILVCHSMGGLVASKYIANGEQNANKVQKAFFIGTPFLGAPKNAYLMTGEGNGSELLDFLEDFPEVIDSFTGRVIANMEAKMSSSYELLPALSSAELYNCGMGTGDIQVSASELTTEIIEKLPEDQYWDAVAKRNSAASFRLSLWDGNGQHVTSHVDSYYMVCGNISTISTINGDKVSNGDGTVPIWSSTLNNRYRDKVHTYPGTGHTGLVKSSTVINDIIAIIRNEK